MTQRQWHVQSALRTRVAGLSCAPGAIRRVSVPNTGGANSEWQIFVPSTPRLRYSPFMDAVLQTGSFMDYGIFLQSIMLAAVEKGLATCPQAALGECPEIVKEELGYPQESIMICGMVMGYEDPEAAINGYRMPRQDISEFVRFFR